MVSNPIEGWRAVEVTNQRTAIDYAHLLQKLVDDYYPEAYMITIGHKLRKSEKSQENLRIVQNSERIGS